METAKLQKQRAEERDRKSAAGAGLTTALSAISVALDSMNKETSRVRGERGARPQGQGHAGRSSRT
jgi:hypothetical protein